MAEVDLDSHINDFLDNTQSVESFFNQYGNEVSFESLKKRMLYQTLLPPPSLSFSLFLSLSLPPSLHFSSLPSLS